MNERQGKKCVIKRELERGGERERERERERKYVRV